MNTSFSKPIKPDKAKNSDKSYFINRETVCSLPKYGSEYNLRPKIFAKKKEK